MKFFSITPLAFIDYSSIILPSLEYVYKTSQRFKIDNSHNEKHSLEVLYWSTQIMKSLKEDKPFTQSEMNVILQSTILHDMCDRKYKLENNLKSIEEHLKQNHPSTREIKAIIDIITTMSYSKTFVDEKIVYPSWINNSTYQRSYHVTREADLLASYNIARMIDFRQRSNYSQDEIIEETTFLYNTRIEKLVERGLFYHKRSQEIAKNLEAVSHYKMTTLKNYKLDKDLDYLKIIDYISLDNLIAEINKI